MAKHFDPDKNDPEAHLSARPDTIDERSEPTTPRALEPQESPLAQVNAADALLIYSDDPVQDSPRSEARSQPSTGRVPDVVVTDDQGEDMTETSPLLPRARLSSTRPTKRYDGAPALEDQSKWQPPREGIWNRIGHQYPSVKAFKHAGHVLIDPKAWDLREVGRIFILRPASMLPSVFLGLLLNLLDALSYGIILFPLGEEVFSSMGADGVSMFYVSCIISQLTYSTGSIFRGGVGSEMVSWNVIGMDTRQD